MIEVCARHRTTHPTIMREGIRFCRLESGQIEIVLMTGAVDHVRYMNEVQWAEVAALIGGYDVEDALRPASGSGS